MHCVPEILIPDVDKVKEIRWIGEIVMFVEKCIKYIEYAVLGFNPSFENYYKLVQFHSSITLFNSMLSGRKID